MKIISKFNDYYDNCLAYGLDHDALYVREESVILETSQAFIRQFPESPQIKMFKPLLCEKTFYQKQRKAHEAFFKTITILIAGKAYGGLQVRLVCPGEPTVTTTFFDQGDLERYLGKYNMSINFDEKKRFIRERDLDVRSLHEHLQLKGDLRFSDVSISLKAPIIVISEENHKIMITRDACLKDYHFFRVIDSFTTFQEINMFISGILAPENRPMITIEDKYKVMEHGFDKLSFRKSPTKKR